MTCVHEHTVADAIRSKKSSSALLVHKQQASLTYINIYINIYINHYLHKYLYK